MEVFKPSSCPLCSGSGWVPVEGTFRVTPCSCQSELRRNRRIVAAGIPRRYLHCLLGHFHDRGNTTLVRAKRRVQEFVDCWPGLDRGLLLMGGCGVGKTHLAVAVLQEIIRADKPGKLLFSNFQDLIQQIHASFDADSDLSKAEILRPLIDADLLVLDELGSQKPTPFIHEILYFIINSRYNDARATVFTSNWLDDPSNAKDETLAMRIGQALRSRLHEMTERVLIAGTDDYRMSVAGKGI